MRSKAADVEYLYQIVMYCEYIGQLVAELDGDYEKFIDRKNRKDRDVSAFYVGQIGEYANKLTVEFKAGHSEISWHQIVGLRNRIFHDYRSIREALLWEVMIDDIPKLNDQCRSILRELDPTAESDIRAELESETTIYK